MAASTERSWKHRHANSNGRDHGRYMNHNCIPNCLKTWMGYEVAVRDIALGEELTNDYANLGMYPDDEFPVP